MCCSLQLRAAVSCCNYDHYLHYHPLLPPPWQVLAEEIQMRAERVRLSTRVNNSSGSATRGQEQRERMMEKVRWIVTWIVTW